MSANGGKTSASASSGPIGERVAVVVATIGRPTVLDRCLGRIRDGSLQPDELIVVDQSPSPETARAVAAVCAAHDARVVHLDEANASAARNTGAVVSRCALVAFTDDDCLARPGWLAALRDAYRRHAAVEPVAAVAGSILTASWEGGSVPVSSRSDPVGRVFRLPVAGTAASWAPWDAGSGGNLLVPVTTLLAAGGFDPRLGPGSAARAAEDIDLLRRVACHGAIVYEPAAIVEHLARTRQSRVRSRHAYGIGMGAMCAAARRPGATGSDLLERYLRHVGREAFRKGPWGPLETWLTLVGIATGLWVRLGQRNRDRDAPAQPVAGADTGSQG
ncbi:MAG TPA: glycosyltransferase [Candidatus Limnocylindrales bacterium]|jgi:glycosyltransferase involved in cell wall biosynthesis